MSVEAKAQTEAPEMVESNRPKPRSIQSGKRKTEGHSDMQPVGKKQRRQVNVNTPHGGTPIGIMGTTATPKMWPTSTMVLLLVHLRPTPYLPLKGAMSARLVDLLACISLASRLVAEMGTAQMGTTTPGMTPPTASGWITLLHPATRTGCADQRPEARGR